MEPPFLLTSMTDSIPDLPLLKQYLFIDECGDPNFYGKRRKPLAGTPGYQPLLMLGALSTDNRRALRKAILAFQAEILADSLYNSIYSVSQPGWFLHARNDHPEVRARFFDFLRRLPDFTISVVIARKKPAIFAQKHHNNPTEFYYDLVHHLLRRRLAPQPEWPQHIYLAQRGKENVDRFQRAVQQAFYHDVATLMGDGAMPICQTLLSKTCPELSVVDYCLWALQRYLLQGEIRFFAALEAKFDLIIDLYDDAPRMGDGRYTQANPFRVEKCSPFEQVVQ